jgi:hypothetical protein
VKPTDAVVLMAIGIIVVAAVVLAALAIMVH